MASKEEWIMSTENKSRYTALQIRLLIALGSVVGLQTLSMTMLNSFVDEGEEIILTALTTGRE